MANSGLLSVLEKMKANKDLKIDADTIITGSEVIEVFSTGSIIVDKLLGRESKIGGVGRGRITEIFGLESSGKTTLALHIAKEVQSKGGNVAFLDFEAALDEEYAKKGIGINMDPERFAWLRPNCMEEGCNAIDYLIDNYKESKIDCVIVDSIKAMIPLVVMEGMMGDEPPMALQARKIGQWLGKLIKRIKDTGTTIILLNQMTKNIKSNPYQSGGEFETPGGLAVRFYASSRLEIKLVTKQTVEKLNPITNKMEEMPDTSLVRVSVIKNKIGTPYRRAEMYIKYGKGIDNKRSIIDMAVAFNIINKGGAWYSYKEDQGGFKLQGDEAMRNFLFAPENKGLLKEIADRIIFPLDEEVKKEGQELEKEEAKLANKEVIKARKNKKDE